MTEPLREEKKNKKNSEVKQKYFCPFCFERMLVSENDEADRLLIKHVRNRECLSVSKHGYDILPEWLREIVSQ